MRGVEACYWHYWQGAKEGVDETGHVVRLNRVMEVVGEKRR